MVNTIISKYNFYKKKFKKIKKKLNFIVENNIIYVGDNLGYIYAYNYSLNKIIWAKNYKIPFSSNIKIINNKILISNQNNNLYILSKKNGELLTILLKKQWGQNLIKFQGVKLPGGTELNGRQLYEDAIRDLDEIKQRMSSEYELPPLDLIG